MGNPIAPNPSLNVKFLQEFSNDIESTLCLIEQFFGPG
jgi:hypothetical protein